MQIYYLQFINHKLNITHITQPQTISNTKVKLF